MQGWVHFHLGEYREAERWSDEGYQRTVSQAPSLALQCLRWRGMARFRLGDWDGVRRDLALARDLLGDEREDPADFLSPMFAVAALVHEYRGEHVVAESVLDVLVAHYERRVIDDRDPLPLSQWAEFVAPILVRRGRRAQARRLLEQSQWRRRSRRGLLVEAALEVVAEAGEWESGAEVLADARAAAAEGGLRALPAAADAFEGLLLRVEGDLAGAIDMLDRAVVAFERLEASWDAARFRLALAETLDEAGFPDRAAAEVRRCLPVLESLRARRELDAARELAEGL
jgi:tetratricopeptide (TPR) repeat protein